MSQKHLEGPRTNGNHADRLMPRLLACVQVPNGQHFRNRLITTNPPADMDTTIRVEVLS